MAPILVFDKTDSKKLDIDYFPSAQLPETDSLKVWYEVSKAIAEDDLNRADAAKTCVEGAQRVRVKDGAEDIANPRRFFAVDSEGVWRWNGQMYDKTVQVLDNEPEISESVEEDRKAAAKKSAKKSSKKQAAAGGGKSGKKLTRQLSATNTSASMSTSTDFSVSHSDFDT